MKTLEEAIETQVKMTTVEALQDAPLNVVNAQQSADEILASPAALGYLEGMVELYLSTAPDPSNEEQFFHFMMGLALSSFAFGVRVGVEMEKQELP